MPREEMVRPAAVSAEICMDLLQDWRDGKIGVAELQWRMWDVCRLYGVDLMQPQPSGSRAE